MQDHAADGGVFELEPELGAALFGDGELTALSTVCPHLGCGIDYVPEKQKFLCACHDSWFALDGAVEEGPSPRGMDSLELQVDEGAKLLKIRHQRFKQGVESKEPV